MSNTNMPDVKFTVTLQKIIDELNLETIYLPKPAEEVLISENEVNRPGLQLMNFYEYFNPERIQILGKTEFAYLSTIGEKNRTEIIHTLFKTKIPALVITRDLDLSSFPELVTLAEQEQIPVLKSKDSTSSFMAALIAFLNVNAPFSQLFSYRFKVLGDNVADVHISAGCGSGNHIGTSLDLVGDSRIGNAL